MMRRRPWVMGLGLQALGPLAGRWALGTGLAASAAPAAQAAPASTASVPSKAPASTATRPRPMLSRAPLAFPRDHGAHPETGVEWWYVTGVLRPGSNDGSDRAAGAGMTTASAAAEQGPRRLPDDVLRQTPAYGFQLTFFRVRRELQQPLDSRFAPTQIMLGHIAVTDLTHKRLHHDQRLLRQGFANAFTDDADAQVRLGDWSLHRSQGRDGLSRYQLAFRSEPANVALSLSLAAPLPPLLQGRQGWSQKGPQAEHASRYVSEPQLAGAGQLAIDGRPAQAVQALCWLDHEWSHAYLGAGDDADATRAVGWDWLGLNLLDGTALMLFQMRRRDGSTLWTGGTWRDPAGHQQDLQQQVGFEALAWWDSPTSRARYPVRWRIRTPQGVWQVQALFDAQEVDARRSTGFLYWEGVVRLLDEAGTLKGWGYLEMTGYAGRVPL